ncbi:hypothetical protein V1511DRAFT_475622 [Dipodascopsis uninucleata]
MPQANQPPQIDSKLIHDLTHHVFDNEDGEEYEGTNFGGFDEYFRNKKIKLRNLDTLLRTKAKDQHLPPIFRECVIHVNGYTRPSMAEIHRLVVSYGGTYVQYMDGKTSVTHIVASSLTPKKMTEFSRYRVVRPEWITSSIESGTLLSWHDFSIIKLPQSQKRISTIPLNKSDNDESSSLRESNSERGTTVTNNHCDRSKSSLTKEQDENDIARLHNIKLLSDPNIRNHTVLNPDFIKNYYAQSRLHHLSTWKSNLKQKYQNIINTNKQNQPQRVDIKYPPKDKVIFHVDFDCFFASVALRSRPHLKNMPVCVGHGGNHNSEVASCNYIARSFGVKNGMWMSRAKTLCPELISIPYEFDKYEESSNHLYNVLLDSGYDRMEAVSIDEALLDVTTICQSESASKVREKALNLAQDIRDRVFSLTQCHVSIGIGTNILQAKLATKKAKPSGQYLLDRDDIKSYIQPLTIDNLPGIGYSIFASLKQNLQIEVVGDLLKVSKSKIQEVAGPKTGEKLIKYANGIDEQQIGEISMRKSVSAEINWGVRFENDRQVEDFLYSLSGELSSRLSSLYLIGTNLTLKIYKRAPHAPLDPPKYLGCGECDSFSQSFVLSAPTDDAEEIGRISNVLLNKLCIPVGEIRGVGLQMTKLSLKHNNAGFSQGILPHQTQVDTPKYFHPKQKDHGDSKTHFQLQRTHDPHKDLDPKNFDSEDKESENTTDLGLSTQYVIPTQVDSQILSELPEDISKKIRTGLETKARSTSDNVAIQPSIKPLKSPSKRTMDLLMSSSKRTKLRKLNYGKPQPVLIKNEKAKDMKEHDYDFLMQIDESILDELPTDIQNEIRELKARLVTSSSKTESSIRNVQTTNEIPEILNRRPVITFQGRSDIDELRKLLTDWIESSTADLEGPHSDDVSLFSHYLVKLVIEERNLSKAVELVQWLEFRRNVLERRLQCVNNGIEIINNLQESEELLGEWLQTIDTLKSSVQEAAYNAELGQINFSS